MNEIAERDRAGNVVARKFGYLVAIGVNLLMLCLIHVAPGWRVLAFLTDATVDVLGLVSASLIAAIVVNVGFIAWDPPVVRAAGEIVTTAIGLAAAVRIWQVFPFDFAGSSVDWELVARVTLGFAIGGSIIAVVVHVVRLLRALA